MKIVNILFNHKKKSAPSNKAFGVERCFIDYSKYLINHGAELLSVFRSDITYLDEIKETKSEILQVNAFNYLDFVSIFSLTKSFYNFAPDIALCHSGRALYFARMARFLSRQKFPIVAVNHGSNIKKFLKSDYILSVNSYFANAIIEAGKSEDSSLVMPNMIKVPDDFKKISKSNFGKVIKIGSLGRIAVEKSYESVLEAMAILRERGIESEFILGGTGDREAHLRNLAKKLNLEDRLKILGWVSDKVNFFHDIDIFILPSLYETFGIVLLEAMLYSTPIIASDSWGPNEIISNGVNGLKFSKSDEAKIPELIADAVEKMFKNEDQAKEMAENSYQELFTKYTSDVVSDRLYKICKEIVAQNK